MKKTCSNPLFIAVFITAFSHTLFAQFPDKISYQAIVRDSSNRLVENSNIGMRVSILQGSVAGTPVYVETYSPNPLTNANGLVTVEIGNGVSVFGVFGEIDWTTGNYFLKVETDINGGTDYSIVGISQLLSVPYAFHAKTADSMTGMLNETDPVFSGSPVSSLEDQQIANWDMSFSWGDHADMGYLTQEIQALSDVLLSGNDGNSRAIKNIANPVDDYDAATKIYVDELFERIEILVGAKAKDIDNNIYQTARIGDQLWMVENLRTTRFSDGTTIPYVLDKNELGLNNKGAYAIYSPNRISGIDTEEEMKNAYGLLYNWDAVSYANGLCPAGWRIPSYDDWEEMFLYLAGKFGLAEEDIGGIIKSCRQVDSPLGGDCTTLNHPRWDNHETYYGTNESGFSLMPNGFYRTDGQSINLGRAAYIWASTESSESGAWGLSVDRYFDFKVHLVKYTKEFFFGVRCLKE